MIETSECPPQKGNFFCGPWSRALVNVPSVPRRFPKTNVRDGGLWDHPGMKPENRETIEIPDMPPRRFQKG
jgi:hypothetical protein